MTPINGITKKWVSSEIKVTVEIISKEKRNPKNLRTIDF